MALTVAREHVSAAQDARVSICGTPIILHRASGETTPTRFSCGSSWCSYCSRVHALHVADCMRMALAGADDPCMVTLTLPRLPEPLETALGGPMSEGAARVAIDRQREVWRRAMERIRWYRHHLDRGELAAANENVPPPGRPDPHAEFASQWDGERWDTASPWGYAWSLEVTAGAEGDHWHPHRHVLVTGRGWAEIVNASWQAAAVDCGYAADGYWTSTHILDDVGGRVAGYLAKVGTFDDHRHASQSLARYLTKGGDLDQVPVEHHGAYVQAVGGLRRYDAGGSMRPLGVARAAPEDAVIGVESVHWTGVVVSAADWYALDTPVARYVVRLTDTASSRKPHHEPQARKTARPPQPP